ncbi:unnamed protein product [Symbiodinium natans]|uniref:Uncharacterized protein n=1 Tax=Symbiodinium natans TaxID=878477 RepID=A0A812SKC7_9DINO|nr:unnamed protein product [Symbiodinium natans]
MGASLCAPDDEVVAVQSTVHECRFPLWAVKVSDFLLLQGPPEPHHVLQEKGLLHQWRPGMFVIFVSHQWLSSTHPDPQGQQVEALQRLLVKMIDGSVKVHEDIISRTEERTMSSTTRRHIAEGFLFFDWFAIPQITARQQGVNEEATKSDAALAVQSIPAYVELCNMFIALVPELTHKDSAKPVNYGTWLSRGWCRAELWCRLLSNKVDTSVVVAYSAAEAEYMFPLDWQYNSIAEGEFTVEADRAEVVRLGEMAVESKIHHLQMQGPLNHYRFYAALRPSLLCEPRRERGVQEFLELFHFKDLEDAARDTSGMNAVMCAVFSGDTGMLRLLAERRADMNHTLQGLGDLGYYDTQTALMVAAKSRQEAPVLATLLELRAHVNGTSRAGITALYLSRSREHVKVLLEHRADMPLTVLRGAATYGGPETVKALLDARCDATHLDDIGASPLNGLALFSRSNSTALETARLLLAHRADVNASTRPSDTLALWSCRLSRVQVAIFGYSNCRKMARLMASLPGISPLGCAAMVGNSELVELFLEHGAELSQNDRGDWPEDLARMNNHYNLLPCWPRSHLGILLPRFLPRRDTGLPAGVSKIRGVPD